MIIKYIAKKTNKNNNQLIVKYLKIIRLLPNQNKRAPVKRVGKFCLSYHFQFCLLQQWGIPDQFCESD